MSQNLVEFLKVLTIVVTWSTCIVVGRHYMLSLDDSREEEEEEASEGNSNTFQETTETIALRAAHQSQTQVKTEDFNSTTVNKN